VGWYLAITFSAFAWIFASNLEAISRKDSAILVGPKKLYSNQGR